MPTPNDEELNKLLTGVTIPADETSLFCIIAQETVFLVVATSTKS
jgi:hypothetical protein